jgi:GWxTD domain-containing protein
VNVGREKRMRSGTLGVGLAALAVAGAALAPAAFASDFPVASTGDIWFQADHAGFLGDKGALVEEYYLRIVNNQLRFEEEDEGASARVHVKLKYQDAEGNGVGEAEQDFDLHAADMTTAGSPDFAQLLVLREPLHPRAAAVEITAEDVNSRKRGLLYMVTGKRRNGHATGTLIRPAIPPDALGVSDLAFAWEAKEGAPDHPFYKNGWDVVPNPARVYGLLQPTLTAYYEVYDRRPEHGAGRPLLVRHELVDRSGAVTVSGPDSVRSEAGEWSRLVTFDVSKAVTGEHRLRVVVTDPATGESATSERTFSVLWKNELWARSEQDLLDEARVLFTEEEYERFRAMSAGDRAVHAEKFWSDADPTPSTPLNEIREEFRRRLAYANRQYGDQGKGMLTDRGRIYIRFGEPDEVQHELLPTQDTQLDQQVPELSEENAAGKLLSSKDEIDTRPYEIWTYTRQGTPLFPERERTTTVTGLRFVFVDETGTGHYVLRYQSDFIGY